MLFLLELIVNGGNYLFRPLFSFLPLHLLVCTAMPLSWKSTLVAALTVFASSAVTATTLTSKLNVDNYFTFYISLDDHTLGAYVGEGNNWQVTSSYSSVLTPGVTNYLHVVVGNQGGPGGFLGAFSLSDTNFAFANGTQSLGTNSTNWVYRWGSFAGSDNTPFSQASVGYGPWGGNFNTANYTGTSAQWLWNYNSTGSSDYNVLYFSTAIQSTVIPEPVPEPSTLALLAVAVLGFAWRRTRRSDSLNA